MKNNNNHVKDNKLLREAIRISHSIADSAIDSVQNVDNVTSLDFKVDEIVEICGKQNISENDKLMLNIAKIVCMKLYKLENSRKRMISCMIPIVEFVLEGNCKYINEEQIIIGRVIDRIVRIAVTKGKKNRYSISTQSSCSIAYASTSSRYEEEDAGKRIAEYLRKKYKIRLGAGRKERISSLIVDFVISGIEITNETIDFILCQLFATSHIDQVIACKRFFIEIALCTAVKLMNLKGKRRTIKSAIFSVLESVDSDQYAKIRISARQINLLSESLATSAMKLSSAEVNFLQRKERVSRLICDFLTSKAEITEAIISLLTFELVNVPEHSKDYLYVRSYVVVALLTVSKIKKMKGDKLAIQAATSTALEHANPNTNLHTTSKYILMDEHQIQLMAQSIAQSAIDQSTHRTATSTTTTTTANIKLSTSKTTTTTANIKISKKALLSKEVEFLTSNIVCTAVSQDDVDDKVTTTASIDHIINKFLKYKQLQLTKNTNIRNKKGSHPKISSIRIKKNHRTFIELALHAALSVKKNGGDIASISAAVASILTCRPLRNYQTLPLTPYMIQKLANNTARKVL